MSAESARAALQRYIDSGHSDLSMMADDVIFITMATGEEVRTPQGLQAMLHHIYHVAFDAHSETRNLIVSDGHAVYEADFVGTHIGEFAGVPATGKAVRVPLCVVYDLENDKVKRGRVYLEIPAMMRQLGVG